MFFDKRNSREWGKIGKVPFLALFPYLHNYIKQQPKKEQINKPKIKKKTETKNSIVCPSWTLAVPPQQVHLAFK
ncbi:hypothetical protein K7X08_017392 [Anisodus acutangulus]|uniref:Uncharacterized protein n=1 Tax=Anisodus acutangulus TaxID=402998 RepID=A0A9Q1LV13_9SOLA|nr:hypothetical protein K7X08_017392 [Anisodus acutangulus]